MRHVEGRIIAKVDLEQKNHYTLSNGIVIRLERDRDNFDRKYTQQVLGVVVSAENIPTDALILFHHNSLHETYKIHNHSNLSGEEIASGIKLFSIMERDCFFWKMSGEESWNPVEGYATALRVFKSYTGILQGIEPTIIKNTLYVTSGELNGLVVCTVKAADYMMTFRDESGRDKNIIRFRPFGNKKDEREPEAICILHDLTDKVNSGELLVGLTISDAAVIEKKEDKNNFFGKLNFKSVTVL